MVLRAAKLWMLRVLLVLRSYVLGCKMRQLASNECWEVGFETKMKMGKGEQSENPTKRSEAAMGSEIMEKETGTSLAKVRNKKYEGTKPRRTQGRLHREGDFLGDPWTSELQVLEARTSQQPKYP